MERFQQDDRPVPILTSSPTQQPPLGRIQYTRTAGATDSPDIVTMIITMHRAYM